MQNIIAPGVVVVRHALDFGGFTGLFSDSQTSVDKATRYTIRSAHAGRLRRSRAGWSSHRPWRRLHQDSRTGPTLYALIDAAMDSPLERCALSYNTIIRAL
ncbi:hypothetical protein [Saccharospirillum impatiens]|uniref:hypothetical protein n=1 Tax=Saccharospirillum impatiens TaxID=169438 RepID=UPI0012F8A0C5|nr:hypothetical protein [Saccharospirillum impatiens]